jgi:hypothetical protein
MQYVFVMIFATAVTCSIICPERPISTTPNHEHGGTCTECVSTDFIDTGKVSVAPAPSVGVVPVGTESTIVVTLKTAPPTTVSFLTVAIEGKPILSAIRSLRI